MKRFLPSAVFSLFLLPAASLSSLDFASAWRHPEIAEKNSVFCDIALAPIPFDGFRLDFLPVDARLEYFPPLPLPLALGVFLKTPHPNLKSFGLRASYHFDLFDPVTDLYLAYSHDFGWLRNGLLAEYNDGPVDFFLYDFRVGVRRFFDSWFGLALETGFHFESVIVMLSIKIN